jgi:hypothetical protein
MAHPGIEVLSPAEASRVAQEVSEHVGTTVEAPQVHAMAQVAQTRDPDVLRFVAKFLGTVEAQAVRRKEIVAGLTKAMAVVIEAPLDDPLREVDEALTLTDASASVARAEAEATRTRRALLRESVSAEEAARLTRRSRQSLERFRREGRVLALRERNQWLYPRWQFEADAAGGIVEGLGAVLKELRLSPAGAAYWLSRKHPRLGSAPIALLRSGGRDAVLGAAREHGERV